VDLARVLISERKLQRVSSSLSSTNLAKPVCASRRSLVQVRSVGSWPIAGIKRRLFPEIPDLSVPSRRPRTFFSHGCETVISSSETPLGPLPLPSPSLPATVPERCSFHIRTRKRRKLREAAKLITLFDFDAYSLPMHLFVSQSSDISISMRNVSETVGLNLLMTGNENVRILNLHISINVS